MSAGLHHTNQECADIIGEFDDDGNNEIDFNEFLNMMWVLESHSPAEGTTEAAMKGGKMHTFNAIRVQEFREVFDSYDLDQSGGIDADELREVFLQFGHRVSDEEIGMLINEYDDDENGVIEFEEFLSMMAQMENGRGKAGEGEDSGDAREIVRKHLLWQHQKNKRRQTAKEAGRAAGMRHAQVGDLWTPDEISKVALRATKATGGTTTDSVAVANSVEKEARELLSRHLYELCARPLMLDTGRNKGGAGKNKNTNKGGKKGSITTGNGSAEIAPRTSRQSQYQRENSLIETQLGGSKVMSTRKSKNSKGKDKKDESGGSAAAVARQEG